MIGLVEGVVRIVSDSEVLVIAGGVGYRVRVPHRTLQGLVEGQVGSLLTHLVVREDVLDLFGFLFESDKELFELLITVPGVGPRSALQILNLADSGTLRKAIGSGDATYLTKVGGIGKKTAEKIVLELAGKLPDDVTDSGDGDVIEALISLGYDRSSARDVVKSLPHDIEGMEARLRAALKHMGR
jgi:Holliday junction DNA helicase RuvA